MCTRCRLSQGALELLSSSLPQWILSSAGAYLPAQASSYWLRVLTCRGGAATLHQKVRFTFVVVCCCCFTLTQTLLTFILFAWSLTNKVLLCRCYAYRRYHNLLASTLLYNTLSRTPVVCIVCYTRFEPRVHSHHPRRGSLTADTEDCVYYPTDCYLWDRAPSTLVAERQLGALKPLKERGYDAFCL